MRSEDSPIWFIAGCLLLGIGRRSGQQPAVAMHHAQRHRRDDADDEGDEEESDDGVHLLGPVVAVHGDGFILARIVAGEGGAEDAVLGGEVDAAHAGRVAAALDVDQQHGLASRRRRLGAALGVLDVDVGAPVEVAGAALSARAPRAVEQAAVVVPAAGHAGHRLLDEVGDQRRDGRVDVQRHQKQQRGAGRHRRHGQKQRRVEPNLLPSRFALAAFANVGQLRELLLA